MTTEVVGMFLDAFVIVSVIEWRRRRDEDRRLERLRQSTRNLLMRVIDSMAYTVEDALRYVESLIGNTACPAPDNPVSQLRQIYEDATRDLTDRYVLLDKATLTVWELVLDF